jgi:hypothetical protein
MIRFYLRRLLDSLSRSLDEGRAWDATLGNPELVARLGPARPALAYEPCPNCGTFIRGAHECPVYFAKPEKVVPITRRRKGSRAAS